MNENTNMTLKESSDTVQCKLTRSEFYKECCEKGDDACQSFEWNMGLCLLTGNTSGTLCIKIVKLLDQQKDFQDHYLEAGLIRNILNAFNKGCRLSLEAIKLD